jgi:hypothetical protein
MASQALNIDDAVNETCPWSGKAIAGDALTLYRDHVVGFCNPGCRDKFVAAVAHFDRAIADADAAADLPLIVRGLD